MTSEPKGQNPGNKTQQKDSEMIQRPRHVKNYFYLASACFLTITFSFFTGCGGDQAPEGSAAKDQDGTSSAALNVCVSSTDVAALTKAVGGTHVNVTGFVQGKNDPHSVNATPSMITALSKAELLVVVGLGLEEAWLPGMVEQASNDQVKPGALGHLDLSVNMRTVAGPEGRGVPNSFHPEDNPHYLADPVEGVKAALAIADKLSALRPDLSDDFKRNADTFAKTIMVALVGEQVAEKTKVSQLEELAIAIETNQLDAFPDLKAKPESLGGWLGKLRSYTDTPVVGDHDLWPYLARRYGIRVLSYLEPEPGVPPTTPHLQKVIASMKVAQCKTILTVQYFDGRHPAFVAEATGATIVAMANQPGGRPGTDTYLDFVNYNARQLFDALSPKAE